MSSISASLVKELRNRIDAPMMECKKALEKTNGDLDKAIEELRKSGQAKAAKKSDRVAAEGVISILTSTDSKTAIMVEINSETDFVARDDNFKTFTEQVAQTALQIKTDDANTLLAAKVAESSQTVDDVRKDLIAKVGENITVRRVKTLESSHRIASYVHGGRIGVLVELNGGTADLAKDIAMHIAATNPLVIKEEEMPADKIASEKSVLSAAEDLKGKPQEVAEKIILGRLNKFIKEMSLLGQPFVKEPKKSVAEVLKAEKAEVVSFSRFLVGEGIEKKEVNFAEEVRAQVAGD